MLIRVHHVMSLSVGQVRRVQVCGELLSQWRCHTTDLLKFSGLKYERRRVHFYRSLQIFLYYIDIYTWCMKEKKCTPLRSYISMAVNVGAELNGYGNVRELMRGPLPCVLFYIPLMWNVCAIQVM